MTRKSDLVTNMSKTTLEKRRARDRARKAAKRQADRTAAAVRRESDPWGFLDVGRLMFEDMLCAGFSLQNFRSPTRDEMTALLREAATIQTPETCRAYDLSPDCVPLRKYRVKPKPASALW